MSYVIQHLNGLIRYRSLLKELVIRDLKVRYRHSVLGMLWTVLNPLLMMIVMTLVFANLFKITIENYPVYILTGQIIFNANADATMQAMNSMVCNASLVKKVYIPKYLFPLANVLSTLVNFGFSFIALLMVMIFTDAPIYLTIFCSWIPVLYLAIFAFGLGLILSAINVFFRDMQHLYSVIITAWSYLSVVFYSVDIIPDRLMAFMKWNPMYQYISFFRQLIIDGTFPSVETNVICVSIALGMLAFGLVFFAKTQDKFILHI